MGGKYEKQKLLCTGKVIGEHGTTVMCYTMIKLSKGQTCPRHGIKQMELILVKTKKRPLPQLPICK